MVQSRKSPEYLQSYSSRIKLGWLVLLLLMVFIIYTYFSYSSNFSALSFRPHQVTRSEDKLDEDMPRIELTHTHLGARLLNSLRTEPSSESTTYVAADSTNKFGTNPTVTSILKSPISYEPAIINSLNRGNKRGSSIAGVLDIQSYTTSMPLEIATSQNDGHDAQVFNTNSEMEQSQLQGDKGEMGEPLDFEGYNEVSDSIEEFAEQDYMEYSNGTETEIDNGSNSSDASAIEMGSEVAYNFSNAEFGIVFSEPNEDNVGAEEDDLSGTNNVEISGGDHKSQLGPPPTTATSMSKEREMMFANLEHLANHSNPHCTISTRFSSWEKGVVTQLGTPIRRDCMKLRTNPQKEVRKVRLQSQVRQWKSTRPWEHYALTYKKKSCQEIRQEFLNNFYISEVEKDFPIAYILVVYTNAGQVLRLLKSIYRPQNLYCIHPDAKQGKTFTDFFKAIAICLDNVFVVSKPLKVFYAHHSIMDSQLNCMQDLVNYPQTRWKYAINLCGREVPLKTNREIVESLQKLKGYSALNLNLLSRYIWSSRFKYKFSLNRRGKIRRTRRRQSKPPHGIKLYKSMNFIAASRAFVWFLLHNPLSMKLRNFLKSVYAPEEHFYSSIYALPQAEGARPPKGVVSHNDMPVIDNCIWINTKWQIKKMGTYCPGKQRVHGICILTGPDLQRINEMGVDSRKPVFFFNKYFLEWDPTPMDCMEERLVKTNMKEYWHDCVPDTHHEHH